jgi:hypothetical protein
MTYDNPLCAAGRAELRLVQCEAHRRRLLPVAVFLAWKRRWGVFQTLLPIALAAIAVSVALVGPREALRYPAFLHTAAGDTGYGAAPWVMYSWPGILTPLFGPAQPGRILLVAAPLGVLTVALAALGWRGQLDPAGAAFPRQWLLLTLASLLADTNLYAQDLVILLPAVAAYLGAAEGKEERCAVAAVALGWLALAAGLFPNEAWEISPFGLLLLAAFTAVSIAQWRAGERPGAAPLAPAARAATP